MCPACPVVVVVDVVLVVDVDESDEWSVSVYECARLPTQMMSWWSLMLFVLLCPVVHGSGPVICPVVLPSIVAQWWCCCCWCRCSFVVGGAVDRSLQLLLLFVAWNGAQIVVLLMVVMVVLMSYLVPSCWCAQLSSGVIMVDRHRYVDGAWCHGAIVPVVLIVPVTLKWWYTVIIVPSYRCWSLLMFWWVDGIDGDVDGGAVPWWAARLMLMLMVVVDGILIVTLLPSCYRWCWWWWWCWWVVIVVVVRCSGAVRCWCCSFCRCWWAQLSLIGDVVMSWWWFCATLLLLSVVVVVERWCYCCWLLLPHCWWWWLLMRWMRCWPRCWLLLLLFFVIHEWIINVIRIVMSYVQFVRWSLLMSCPVIVVIRSAVVRSHSRSAFVVRSRP